MLSERNLTKSSGSETRTSVTDKHLKKILYSEDEEKEHQKMCSWNRFDLIVIALNILLALIVYLMVRVSIVFLLLVVYCGMLYYLFLLKSLWSYIRTEESLENYFDRINKP